MHTVSIHSEIACHLDIICYEKTSPAYGPLSYLGGSFDNIHCFCGKNKLFGRRRLCLINSAEIKKNSKDCNCGGFGSWTGQGFGRDQTGQDCDTRTGPVGNPDIDDGNLPGTENATCSEPPAQCPACDLPAAEVDHNDTGHPHQGEPRQEPSQDKTAL